MSSDGRVRGADLREAATFALDPALVADCLDPTQPLDALFQRAWTSSLASIRRAERGGGLAGVTGHVAESVAGILLDELGYATLWHFTGPGRHGIDLLALAPCGERIVAIEVKGTLRPGVWPRLSRGTLAQMSTGWVDKADNPGMAEWALQSGDVYGAVVLINLVDHVYRVGITADFARLRPITTREQLVDLAWVDESA